MSMTEESKGGDLFVVDNSDEGWTGLRYLQEWTEIAKSFDIATGFFEIGSLLDLDGHWQQLEKIRILMGDEMTHRTRRALNDAVRARTASSLDHSLEPSNQYARVQMVKSAASRTDPVVQHYKEQLDALEKSSRPRLANADRAVDAFVTQVREEMIRESLDRAEAAAWEERMRVSMVLDPAPVRVDARMRPDR